MTCRRPHRGAGRAEIQFLGVIWSSPVLLPVPFPLRPQPQLPQPPPEVGEAPAHSPRRAVDPEAAHGDLRVLQVDTVGQQGLHVLIVLRLQL